MAAPKAVWLVYLTVVLSVAVKVDPKALQPAVLMVVNLVARMALV